LFATIAVNGSTPYELQGVSVALGGLAARVIYVSVGQVKFQVPANVATGSVEVLVATQDGYLSRANVTIATNAFRIMTDGTGAALATNVRKETSGSFDVVTPENFGVDKRTRLRLFATGLSGSAQNSNPNNDLIVNGVRQPNFSESVSVEARMADGRVFSLPVEFAGIEGTLNGLDQVSFILLPQLNGGGSVRLTVIVSGVRSNVGTITVR
jgi:uncharacterized protein (TIGR03437 family)